MTDFSQFELRHLRHTIGASVSRMAELLGMSGRGGASDTVRKLENGAKPVSGPVQRLARYMQQGTDTGGTRDVLPEFLLGADMAGQIDSEWIFHTRYPRFLATLTDQPVSGMESASMDGIEWLVVTLWIDEPVGDPTEILDRGAALFLSYSNQAMDQLD